ncbi:MAG: 5-formyltetrahydrofolate cyclo-ligase [Desulfovibrio sp.]
MQNGKSEIRRPLLEKRRSLSTAEQEEAAQGAAEFISALPEWKRAKEVLLYWPVRGELDVRPLVHELWERGVTVLLPRCRPEEQGIMDICATSCESDLCCGMFSIMEPAESCAIVETVAPDVALIPGVGFDRLGHRLGVGGGYYDRILAREEMQNTLTIGMAYQFQIQESIPAEEWDIPMKALCTEEEYICCL